MTSSPDAAVSDSSRAARAGVVGAYVLLGLTLLVTRLVGLGRSYWLDEIETVRDFIRIGPGEILAGDRVNHALFCLFGWATSELIGESEIALRLWSVIPFLVGVALVTAWLHRRMGALSGILFLFFCTASPLLLDITRQARGYGLAFLAMAVLVVSALEAERTRKAWLVVVFCAAGVVGTWTLPNLAIAFVAMGVILATARELRRPATVGLVVSLIASAAFYAPLLDALQTGAQQEYGAPINWRWLVSAPIDQILTPALIWIDGTILVPGLVWLPVTAAVMLVLVASPMLRARRTALLLLAAPVATVLTLWGSQAGLAPRFLSYLLVPLLMLLATGAAAILARLTMRPLWARSLIVVLLLAVTSYAFVTRAPDVVRKPREAHRDAASAILAGTSTSTPVFAYMTRPTALEFYLGRPVTRPASATDPTVCNRSEAIALVVQPWVLPPAAFPCMNRPGTKTFRFEQYTRGGEIGVWLIPASP